MIKLRFNFHHAYGNLYRSNETTRKIYNSMCGNFGIWKWEYGMNRSTVSVELHYLNLKYIVRLRCLVLSILETIPMKSLIIDLKYNENCVTLERINFRRK